MPGQPLPSDRHAECSGPWQLSNKALNGFIAVSKTVFLNQILPDPLNRQTGVQFGHDYISEMGRRRARGQVRAGEHFGRFCLPEAIVSGDGLAPDSGLSL
jgi:hypothetical protein